MQILVAVPTPFRSDLSLDTKSLQPYLESLLDAGIDAVLLAGTTGEGSSLTLAERKRLLAAAAKRLPPEKIWIGLHTSSVAEAVDLAEEAEGKASAMLLTPPYYEVESGEEGTIRFFETVMARSPLPVVLYHIPRRTHIPVTDRILAGLSGHPRFGGVKDSGGNIDRTGKFALAGHRVWLGSDTSLPAAEALGVAGVISALGAVAPRLVVRAAREKDLDAGERLTALRNALRGPSLPAGLKALLAHKKTMSSLCRAPLACADLPENILEGIE